MKNFTFQKRSKKMRLYQRANPTSSPGLFPQKMGGAGRPHPFFEGKALGTRLRANHADQKQLPQKINMHVAK